MKYYIIQTEMQRQVREFSIIKVDEFVEQKLLENLHEDVRIIADGNSLAEVILKFENLSFENRSNLY